MATYIQGVTDYIPQLQPFQPDYNFLGNVLQTKQARYDAAHKQLSSLYGTMLNSPMLRDENIEKRNDFFKNINQDIQRMSGLDLSLQQNVDQASEIFKGLYEDKNIIKDMTWTKNYMNQREKGQMLKTCADPDKCGGQWWEGGDKYLDYKAKEFKEASSEDAMNFKDVEYIAAQNFTDKAMKAAKDSGFSVKWDEVQGDWIVHHKNGKGLTPTLTEFFISKFGNDGNMMSYMKAQAYLQRKDWVTQNIGNYNNNDLEANAGYANTLYENSLKNLKNDKDKADKKDEIATIQNKQIDDHIKENGYVEGQDWLSDWTAMKDEKAVTSQTKAVYKKAVDDANLIKYNKDNIKLYLDQIDNMMAMSMLKKSSLNAAEEYSKATEEQTREANPFAIQAKQQAFQRSMAREREGYIDPATGEYRPGTDFMQQKLLKDYEWQHETEVLKKQAEAIVQNQGKINPNLDESKKSATDILGPSFTVKNNLNKAGTLFNEGIDIKRNAIQTMLEAAKSSYKQEQLAGGTGTTYENLKPFLTKLVGNSKIDPLKLLSGDTEANNKFKEYLNQNQGGNAISTYSGIKDYTDPKTAVGVLNSKWTKNVQDKLTAYNKGVKLNEERYNFIIQDNKEGSERAQKEFLANLYNKTSFKEGDAWKEMFDKTINGVGIIVQDSPNAIKDALLRKESRAMTSGIRQIDAAARAYADKNKNSFKGGYEFDVSSGAKAKTKFIKDSEGGRIEYEPPTVYKDEWTHAYEYAVNVFAKNKAGYDAMYNEKAGNWNRSAAGKGNAKFSVASGGFIDAAGGNNLESNNLFFEMMQNYNSLKSEAVVAFGAFTDDKPSTSDDRAVRALQKYAEDFANGSPLNKQGIPTDKTRARGDINVTRIISDDPTKMAFRINMSQDWIEDNTSTDSKSKTIEKVATTDAQKGIVVYLPADKVKGDFMSKSEYQVEDAMMEKNGYISVENPSGSAVMTRIGNSYQLDVITKTIGPDGKPSTKHSVSTHGLDFEPSVFKDMFTNKLDWLDYANQTNLEIAAQNSGIKDPNQLFK